MESEGNKKGEIWGVYTSVNSHNYLSGLCSISGGSRGNGWHGNG